MIKSGFSLLELCFVMALCALLATLMVSGNRFLQQILMRAEVEKLYTICRYLQQTAMTTNEICTLKFDVAHGTYRYGDTQEKLPAQIKLGVADGVLGPPSSPTKAIDNPVTFSENTIEFHPSGSIKSGTVYLVDSGHHYMCALSCPVSHVSFIRVYEYNGGWQLLS